MEGLRKKGSILLHIRFRIHRSILKEKKIEKGLSLKVIARVIYCEAINYPISRTSRKKLSIISTLEYTKSILKVY